LTGVVVQKRLMDEHPEVARAIAVASTRGLHFCAVNAEQCIQDFVDLNEGRDFDLTLAEWEVALDVQYGIDPEAVADVDPLTLGWWDPDLIAGTIPDLRETFGVETEFDPTTLYTNDYMTQP
jgi:ABC-type nitrate/sulfonate/bicarbonate transport system substrate-binding protein